MVICYIFLRIKQIFTLIFQLDPLAPVTKVQGVGLGVPIVCDTNSTLFSVILAKDGGYLDNTYNIFFCFSCGSVKDFKDFVDVVMSGDGS